MFTSAAMSDETHHSFTFNGNANFNGAIGCVFGPSNRVTISSLNNNTASAPMSSEINNTFTFNGNSAAIGCAIGSTQATITSSNNTTTDVQKPTGWQSKSALGTNDGFQVVSDDKRLGDNDENVVTESISKTSGPALAAHARRVVTVGRFAQKSAALGHFCSDGTAPTTQKT